VPKRLTLAAALLVLVACHGSSTPTELSTEGPHGRLSGTVTIGPNCPGAETSTACPTPPDAYAARKILIYNSARSELLFTVDISSQGLYTILLTPGTYTVDAKLTGADKTGDVPQSVTIVANDTKVLDVRIDTGLR
jgi:hypothetical protein